MQIFKLENMIRGWFVGNFEPSVLKSKDVEVGVKEYQKGDIIVIEPNEASDFEALEDTISVVVKMPCVLDDKYLGEAK
ncbi:hypothetical protein [Campylobacter helveticus]|uniref:hypothetical protein n=1 Tax=Campylobacter helveticus TaxID=28898 RepID=UPI00104EB550|nr:hypothetical protein [Campylobacter helveticus]QBL12339.1 hypothetical protein A0073_08025 [Campylobacter helveticus]